MLLGVVRRVGALAEDRGFFPGDRVATLASLSLTPLTVSRIRAVRPVSAQVDVEGTAIIFGSAPLARMPADLAERLALAILDVAGAAPQVARLASPGDTVVVLGAGGKSGLLCCAEARRRVGAQGKVIGLEASPGFAEDLRVLRICDSVAAIDARDPLAVRAAMLELTGGRGADLTLSCVNVPGVELSAVVATRDRGKVYYFAMSTSFTAAALGAEGIGRDVDLYIGNGYAHGHAEHISSSCGPTSPSPRCSRRATAESVWSGRRERSVAREVEGGVLQHVDRGRPTTPARSSLIHTLNRAGRRTRRSRQPDLRRARCARHPPPIGARHVPPAGTAADHRRRS